MINSLGIKKLSKDTKIVVAMSGGVDSVRCCRLNERARI
jgi:tRNA(Ile)-lysidine synthase TilS/MesJ